MSFLPIIGTGFPQRREFPLLLRLRRFLTLHKKVILENWCPAEESWPSRREAHILVRCRKANAGHDHERLKNPEKLAKGCVQSDVLRGALRAINNWRELIGFYSRLSGIIPPKTTRGDEQRARLGRPSGTVADAFFLISFRAGNQAWRTFMLPYSADAFRSRRSLQPISTS